MMKRSYQLSPTQTGWQNVTSIDYAGALNEEQLAAVQSEPSPALVIAGAGSGKTRTLTYRVGWLLEQGYHPEEILLLTFTNKAAREMLERVERLLPERSHDLWGGTFHSICHRILRRHAPLMGYENYFTIFDREDQLSLVNAILTEEGLRKKEKRFPKAALLVEILSLSNNLGVSLHDVIVESYPYFLDLEETIIKVITEYQLRKEKMGALDFDDLLLKTYQLFLDHPAVAALYQKRFRAILVDEYQDTNDIQAALVDLLAKEHQHLMVVGDDAQSIYSWRGANPHHMLQFKERYPQAKEFRIQINYRSVPQILELANQSIRHNRSQFLKELRPVRKPHSIAPAWVPLGTNHQQAAFVAQRIGELHEEGIAYHEMAILYRSHYHSMEIQLELTKRNLPFRVTSGLRFFEQAHIKDVAAFLKVALNPYDEVSITRIAQMLPGVGPKTALSLVRQIPTLLGKERHFHRLHEVTLPAKARPLWKQMVHAFEEITLPRESEMTLLPPAEAIPIIIMAFYEEWMQEEFTNAASRRDDLTTLANYGASFADTTEFLARLALLGDPGEERSHSESEDYLCLSSIHNAKGLEWKVVFLIWLSEGMFPTARSLEQASSLEEERRLFYVAVTRAQEELYLTYPQMRLPIYDGNGFQRPSRFVNEVGGSFEEWQIT